MNNKNIEVEKKYYFGLSLIPQVGAKTLAKLISYFGSAQKAWFATAKEIEKLNIRSKTKKIILEKREKIDLKENMKILDSNQIKLLIIDDSNYPALLKEIYDPPMLLYYKGNLDWQKALFFGVVGTRKITAYGKRAIEEIVSQLAVLGLTIVSGMAKGGDAKAHQTAIEAGGTTVGVLGSGLNCIYPSENKNLSQQIIQHGALISEFPPDMQPLKQNFPMRNRIISGLSLGLLVVEASEKSGTLITANCALEQNREVFALPGSIFNPYSKGPAKLIKMGAKLVLNIDDILEELNLEARREIKKSENILPSSEEEKKILNILDLHEYVIIDELVQTLRLPSSKVMSILTIMEMKGKVKSLGRGKYSK